MDEKKAKELRKILESASSNKKVAGKNILMRSLRETHSSKHGKTAHAKGGDHWKNFSKT